MKLVDFLEDFALTELRLRIGAKLIPKVESVALPKLLNATELSVIASEGIELDDLELVRVEGDNTLSFKGYRVALYIRDHGLVREEQTLPVFHVAYCPIIQSMKDNKRLYRYAVTHQEDEYFTLNWIGEHTARFTQQLTVCQRCLSILKWDQFDRHVMSKEAQLLIVFAFTLKTFFTRYPKKIAV